MSLGSLQGRVGAFNHATNDLEPELISNLCAKQPGTVTNTRLIRMHN